MSVLSDSYRALGEQRKAEYRAWKRRGNPWKTCPTCGHRNLELLPSDYEESEEDREIDENNPLWTKL